MQYHVFKNIKTIEAQLSLYHSPGSLCIPGPNAFIPCNLGHSFYILSFQISYCFSANDDCIAVVVPKEQYFKAFLQLKHC